MKIISWIKEKIGFKTAINYWNAPTSAKNIKDRYANLYQAYCSFHEEINFPESENSVNNISGNYSVGGHNSWDKKSQYNGNFSLLKIKNNFEAKWNLGFSDQIQTGKGFLYKNFLHIQFQYKDDEHSFNGEVIFLFINENKAIGFWIEEGIFEVGYEELTLKNKGF